MPSPVRIYVIHHPKYLHGPRMCQHIYEWFRLPNLEGIPVYVRSSPRAPFGAAEAAADHLDSATPDYPMVLQAADPPEETPAGARGGVLEYFVPLVDSHMVRDVAWRDYLCCLAEGVPQPKEGPGGRVAAPGGGASCAQPGLGGNRCAMFPIAMDGTAFNLPRQIISTNFIRHASSAPKPADDQEAVAETLKFLTEALARDLNARLFPQQAGRKLQIFISYARADGPETPRRLRAYIDGQTQCSAFLDENDIAFGTAYEDVLAESTGNLSRALIVVRGDHYADRPVCRWELEKFIRSRPPRSSAGEIHVFHPALVVDTTKGSKMTRELPELSQLPLVRWNDEGGEERPGGQDGRHSQARRCFSMLMREVLLGARNYLAALGLVQRAKLTDKDLVVNRMPGPIVLHELICERKRVSVVHYPGNGLPLIELKFLEKMFPQISFRAFRDLTGGFLKEMERRWKRAAAARRPVILLSTGDTGELARLGYMPEHQRELLIYLLRPLIRLDCDVIYGGRAPKLTSPGAEEWRENHTLTLLDLLKDEREYRRKAPRSKAGTASPGRLLNFSYWPSCLEVTAADEASWIDVCSVIRFHPGSAGMGFSADFLQSLPPKDSLEWLALKAVVASKAREVMAGGFPCPVPGGPGRRVEPTAFVGVGGKVRGFSGIMPGIFEEFLCAARRKLPVYLIGGLGGATGVLAEALCDPRGQSHPCLSFDHHHKKSSQLIAAVRQLRKDHPGAGIPDPAERFADLQRMIGRVRRSKFKLLHNGMSEEANRALLQESGQTEAVKMVWSGLTGLPAEVSPSS